MGGEGLKRRGWGEGRGRREGGLKRRGWGGGRGRREGEG